MCKDIQEYLKISPASSCRSVDDKYERSRPFQGMGAVFIAQVSGIELSWQSLLAIIDGGIFCHWCRRRAGFGFILLAYVFGSAGLPLEGMALFVGIDHIREMISTVLNVLGDAVCAVYIAKKEGELDERVYYQQELVGIEGDEV